ncbi:DegT/DnrJ/EryC1/StrS family aminotransferase [Marivirga arenosa]|uniref:DegT/DnrJ/EryC1/StrS family aminotransferase n=1 Tax=Marivirga arenosa TaxID=3059076 RepID=A0AA52EZR5_9BACT|nr:DegT/DnrJ/EryC1/StrS family aminotransferase [Marivirga sp. BKB1-2]WNB17738.1 DegT/DnrJ/EryC1/StrS family aminotransferase [Marivirga sp. BKB1-2]
MDNIQMVDLGGQLKHIRKEVDEAIANVLNTTAFIKGEDFKEFTSELALWNNSKHTIGVANGTDGLQIAMMALGLKPGDEVIVPVFTYVATAEVIALLQLKPVFIDVEPDTFNIDVRQLETVLTAKTKAIVPVHLFGQISNMNSINEFAIKNSLYIIEDVAQAIGAEYNGKKAGNLGHIGVTSFFPSKNLGCFGDGGAIFTNDDQLAENIRMIANHGQKVKYYHDVIGVNSRLDTLQAAILRVKLKELNNYIISRQSAAQYYDQELSEVDWIETPGRFEDSTHVFHQYTIKVKNGKRDNLKEYLQNKGIPSMIYYPVPLHLQKAYSGLAVKGDFPVSEQLCDEVLSLPMHTELDDHQLEYICSTIKSFK